MKHVRAGRPCHDRNMVQSPVPSRPFAVLCVGEEARRAVEAALQPDPTGSLEIVSVDAPSQANDAATELRSKGMHLAMIVASVWDIRDQGELFPSGPQRPRLLAMGHPSIPVQADDFVDPDDGIEAFRLKARDLIADYALTYARELLPRIAELLDARQLALVLADESLRNSPQLDCPVQLRQSFATVASLSEEDAEDQMLQGIDRVLGRPGRVHLPEGAVLFTEGELIKGLWLVEKGSVSLTRMINGREVVFHKKSVGRVVGLMALADRRKAFFTCRAVTPITAIYLEWSQLDLALQQEPTLWFLFINVLVRSLTRRVRRVIELQVEVERLNQALQSERDQLAETIARLKEAQARLIESEKMATLGQLVAGIGHELNNPATAIGRAVEYATDDARELIRHLPDSDMLIGAMESGRTIEPLSTEELRARRQALAKATGDEQLARRLLRMGITTIEDYRSIFGKDSPDHRQQRLALRERAYQLGSSLRNIQSGSDRISAIVKSLRSYARTDRETPGEVNIHEGLEDTLRLFGAQLQSVTVVREYGRIPAIQGYAAQLNQVWTNIIANALEAMQNKGQLTLQTEDRGDGTIAVRIIDSGPGIPPEHQHRVFDLNFTTKHAGAGFGLGMGLLICRQIVTRHGGTIGIESRPGRTVVEVILPIESRVVADGRHSENSVITSI